MNDNALLIAEPIIENDVKDTSCDKNISVYISDDLMSVCVKLSEPTEGNEQITTEDILNELTRLGVVVGIKQTSISRLVQYCIYDKSFIIAQGILPQPAVEAEVNYCFKHNEKITPKILDNGNVDYKNIGFTNEVTEGQVLCNITPAVQGENGMDVLGKVKSVAQSNVELKINGSHTKLSEDGMQLYATQDGHVSIKNGKVCVRRVMIVDQVDKSTGNILFSGDITVEGDVSDGFTVRAGGVMTVKGVVENATLVAGHDIVVKKGINGKNSVISAGGNLRVGYIETGKIKVKGSIYVDAVLNAEIDCGDSMMVLGARGHLIGGVYRITNKLEVKEIGNDANIFTDITILAPPAPNVDRDDIVANIATCKESIVQIISVLQASKSSTMPLATKQSMIAEVMESKKTLESDLKVMVKELEVIDSVTEIIYTERLILHGHMYPNVSLNISGVMFKNTIMRPASTISRKNEAVHFGLYK